jgi:hypothetical protein
VVNKFVNLALSVKYIPDNYLHGETGGWEERRLFLCLIAACYTTTGTEDTLRDMSPQE